MYVLQWWYAYLKEYLIVKNTLTILISGYANGNCVEYMEKSLFNISLNPSS